jgi:hypothetical protein
MGCGCGKNKVQPTTEQPVVYQQVYTAETTCPITIEQVNSWLVVVQCVKDNSYHKQLNVSEYTVNLYIGILLSTQNHVRHGGSVCYYQSRLEEIEAFVFNVKNTGLCLS